jgi:hypothetical protein
MIVSLMARSVHGEAPKTIRRVLTVVVVALILLQISQSVQLLQQKGLALQISQIAAMAPNTMVGQYVLPPVEWLFRPMASKDFISESVPLLIVRLPILLLLIGTVYLLGADFGEASAARTDQAILRRESAMRSGSAAGTSKLARRLVLPAPRWRFGGIAAIGWWQTVNLLRILPRYLAFTAVVLGIMIVLPAMVDKRSMSGINGVAWLSGLSLYGDFLLLPIANWRIVVGQLVGPFVPVLVIHSMTTFVFAVAFPIPWLYLLCTVVALLPAALVIAANLNTLGIWGVIQPRALQQRDILAAGRAMASVWLFGIMLLPAIFLAVSFGMIAEIVLGRWLPEWCGLILGCGLGCLIASAGYIYLIARTFDRWQPSMADRGDQEREHDG